MPAKSTDTASEAQRRVIVSIPPDDAKSLDAIGSKLSRAVQEQTGIAIDLSRAQVVSSLIKTAVAAQQDGDQAS